MDEWEKDIKEGGKYFFTRQVSNLTENWPSCSTFDWIETKALLWPSPSHIDGSLALVFRLLQLILIALTSVSGQSRRGVRKDTSRLGWKPMEGASGIHGWTAT